MAFQCPQSSGAEDEEETLVPGPVIEAPAGPECGRAGGDGSEVVLPGDTPPARAALAPGGLPGKDPDEDFEELTMEGVDNEFRLILVGKSGGGKSATGNTILGRREFKSILTAKTTTLKCQRGQGSWKDTKISVVDTPALFDSEDDDETVNDEIRVCEELSRPGPHALIFVTQVGRFTTEDAAAAKRIWDIFGDESAKHTIILFTCVEDLGGSLLDEYVTQSNNWNLRELIQRCGNRFCGFNNKSVGAERERQVSELMEMVHRTFVENGGRYYSTRFNYGTSISRC